MPAVGTAHPGRRRVGRLPAVMATLGVLVLGTTSPALAAEQETTVPAPLTSRFEPVSPARVLDTRSGVGAPAAALPPGSTLTVQVAGRGGVPQVAVTAVVLNLTMTESTGAGYVQALPAGSGIAGSSSNVNVTGPGQTVANLAVVPLGTGGAVTLVDVAGGHLVADVLGFFTASEATEAGRYVPVRPARVLDSRRTSPSGSGATLRVPVTGRFGVPGTGVSAVAMTVTATASRGPGFVQVVPADGATVLGTTSNVNLTAADQTVANLVLVPVGAGGAVDVHTATETDVILDVVGYMTGTGATRSTDGLFVPLTPARLSDTRLTGGLAPGTTLTHPLGAAGLPTTGVGAVMANLTATETSGAGYVQAFPQGRGAPGASSNVNFTAPGQTVAAAAVVQLGDTAGVAIHTPTATHLVVDASGYFTGAPVGQVRHDLVTVGNNWDGELGIGAPSPGRLAPVVVGGSGDWVSVAAGGRHSAAVRADGTLWTWGSNDAGELGDGTTEARSAPVQVAPGHRWTAVAAGWAHTVALDADGSLWAWGYGVFGELGDGRSTTSAVPVRVAGGHTWQSLTAGDSFTVAIATDGTLWAWGSKRGAILRDDDLVPSNGPVPLQVGTASDWVAVDAGRDHVVALRADGSAWAWGDNNSGQLGNDRGSNGRDWSAVPIPVLADERFVTVSAGTVGASAITDEGALWAWGRGYLGDGLWSAQDRPVRVGTDTDWSTVATGSGSSIAVKTDGSLWRWGDWPDGGPLVTLLTPEQVGTSVAWSAVTMYDDHAVALG